MHKTVFISSLIVCRISFAQITIGSDLPPMNGALLDLKNKHDNTSDKGLGLPRVILHSLNGDLGQSLDPSAPPSSLDNDSHIGLLVYNTSKNETITNRICPGLHVWNGTEWQPIIPYPKIQTQRILKSNKINSFTFLDPNNTSDPKWAELNKNPSDYPLGYVGVFTDNRESIPETYNYTRFYVGYANRTNTYEIKTSYSCNTNTPNWETSTEQKSYDIFEDGVWMTDNLRAETIDPIRDKIGDTPIALTGNNYGDYPYSETFAAWGYPNKQTTNKERHGLLYNWAAATNGNKGEYEIMHPIQEGGLNEGPQIQGICPTGWHLPSDREWTDLENGIIRKTSIFSTSPDIGNQNTILYNLEGDRGTNLGTAMISSTTILPQALPGTSKTSTTGGFDIPLSGNAQQGSAYSFGTSAYYFSSSYASYLDNSTIYNSPWIRLLNYTYNTYRNVNTPVIFSSIRCKKN